AANLQDRPAAGADALEIKAGPCLHKLRRAKRLDHWKANCSIAIEVLLEGGLDRPKRCIRPRHLGNDIGNVVAVAVGAPDGVVAGCGILPGHIVSSAGLLDPDRRPTSPARRSSDLAANLQDRPAAGADALEIKA